METSEIIVEVPPSNNVEEIAPIEEREDIQHQTQTQSQPPVKLSPKDILLGKVGELEDEAEECQANGEYKQAISLYQRVSEILHGLLANEPQGNVEIALHLKEVLSAKDRVQHLQEIEKVQPSVPLDSSTECNVMISIENISVYQIVGLQGDHDRRLLGTGVLRILNCSSELYMMQLIPESDESQFQFPLTKSIPCLCTSRGYYVFPMPGNIFYGVVFPKEIHDAYIQIFENVLQDCCTFRKLPSFQPEEKHEEVAIVTTTTTTTTPTDLIVPQEQVSFSVKALNVVNSGIAVGAEKIATGIIVGGQYLTTGVEKGGAFIKNRITPNEEPLKVSPKVTNTLFVASKVSPMAVAVSKALIASLVTLADEIGSTIADGVSKTKIGSKLSTKKETPTTLAAKEVGKTSLKAFVNIWEAAEHAGRQLLDGTRTVTVEIVNKKYGFEAAQATRDGLGVAGNMLETAYNVNQLGIKKLAQRTVRHTGQHTVERLFTATEVEMIEQPKIEQPKQNLLTQ